MSRKAAMEGLRQGDNYLYLLPTGKSDFDGTKNDKYISLGVHLSFLKLFSKRLRWNEMFNKPKKPTVTKVFRWLISNEPDEKTKKSTTVFNNIGKLTALLICGDLVEAGILPMPSASEWAKSILKMLNMQLNPG